MKALVISAFVLVAVTMGLSAFAPAMVPSLATDSSFTENTILPSAWAQCHPGDDPSSPDEGVDCDGGDQEGPDEDQDED